MRQIDEVANLSGKSIGNKIIVISPTNNKWSEAIWLFFQNKRVFVKQFSQNSTLQPEGDPLPTNFHAILSEVQTNTIEKYCESRTVALIPKPFDNCEYMSVFQSIHR